MIDTSYIKYFEHFRTCVKIIENFTHEFVSFIQLLRNNQATLTLVKNAYIYKRSKHIDIIYYYIRNLCKINCIRAVFVSNAEIVANKLTKLLSKNKFKIFVKQLEIQNLKKDES